MKKIKFSISIYSHLFAHQKLKILYLTSQFTYTKLTNEIEPVHMAKHLIRFISKTKFQIVCCQKRNFEPCEWISENWNSCYKKEGESCAMLYDQKNARLHSFPSSSFAFSNAHTKVVYKSFCAYKEKNPFFRFLNGRNRSTANEVWCCF